MEYPGGVFYLCYDCVLCLLIRDRRTASLGRMGAAFWSVTLSPCDQSSTCPPECRGLGEAGPAPTDRTGGS